jgi:hypothetical protein
VATRGVAGYHLWWRWRRHTGLTAEVEYYVDRSLHFDGVSI